MSRAVMRSLSLLVLEAHFHRRSGPGGGRILSSTGTPSAQRFSGVGKFTQRQVALAARSTPALGW